MPSPIYKWKFIFIDEAGTVQDLSRRFTWRGKASAPSMQPASEQNQSDSTATLSFLATESYNIDAGLMYMAGMADTVTGEFTDTIGGLPSPLYAGYLVENADMGAGPRHRMPLTMVPLSWDLDTTRIDLWPDPTTIGAVVPPGDTALQWLSTGGTGYSGLIPTFLGGSGGVAINIDSALGATVFDAAVMPGTPQREQGTNGGTWGVTYLRKAIDDIVLAIRFINYPTIVEPVVYMDAIIDPGDATLLKPRFNLTDRLDTSGTPLFTLSTAPSGPGEYAIEEIDFEHHRDDRDARQRICVKGAGTDPPWPDPTAVLIYAESYNGSHTRPGTRYQTSPGRALIFQSDELSTIAQCQDLADRLEALRWGADGWVQVTCQKYAPAGSLIILNVPQAGFVNQVFRVSRCINLGRLGTPKWRIIIGAEPPDLAAYFAGYAHKIAALSQIATQQATGLIPGAPAAGVHSNSPINAATNTGRAADGVTYRTTQPTAPKPDGTRTVGTIRERHLDPDGVVHEWVNDDDGTGHPHHYILGPITALGEYYWAAPDAVSLIRVIKKDKTGALATGITLGSWKVDGSAAAFAPSSAHPLAVPRESVVAVTLTGTLPTGGITLLVSESES